MFCLLFGWEIFGVGILPFIVVIHGLAIQSIFFSDMICYVNLLFKNSESFYRSAFLDLRSTSGASCFEQNPKGDVRLEFIVHGSILDLYFYVQIWYRSEESINCYFSPKNNVVMVMQSFIMVVAPHFWGFLVYCLILSSVQRMICNILLIYCHISDF